jgi:hypothetical protein
LLLTLFMPASRQAGEGSQAGLSGVCGSDRYPGHGIDASNHSNRRGHHWLTALSSPDPTLTDATMESVRQWRYQPTLLSGQPVEIVTAISVNFRLD